jgi:uncharacterized repeat protein (TIGR01451 family)
MKKLTIVFLSLVFLLVGQNALASVSWNTASNDCPSLNIENSNTGSGFGTPCWTGTSVSASPNDVVRVRIYYHNTGNTTATNTKVRLNYSGSNSSYHSFNGQIISDQGNISFGPVSVNLSSSQDLTFQSVKWYTNNSQNLTSLINGQSGSEVLNSGLSIGSIASGWSTQGTVVISFKVGNNNNNQSNCNINYFEVDGSSSTTINDGDSAHLTWDTDNCTSVNISPTVGSVNDSGSKNVYPSYDTTYTLKAYDSNGSYQTDTVKVYVDEEEEEEESCEITDFYASHTSINKGASTTLHWDTENCDYVNISNVGSYLPTSYSKVIYPSITTTYNLKAYGDGYDPSDSVQVKVNDYAPVYVPTYVAPTYVPPAPVVPKVIVQQVSTVKEEVSPIQLKIENNQYQCLTVLREGDLVYYTVTYKNIGSQKLTNTSLKVVLPKGFSYRNSSAGSYSKEDNTLFVFLGDLAKGQEGNLSLTAQVDRLYGESEIITTALLVYTNSRGSQENAIAYVSNNPASYGRNNNLAAGAWLSGFYGIGVINWLLLFIIILLIILLVSRYYYRSHR